MIASSRGQAPPKKIHSQRKPVTHKKGRRWVSGTTREPPPSNLTLAEKVLAVLLYKFRTLISIVQKIPTMTPLKRSSSLPNSPLNNSRLRDSLNLTLWSKQDHSCTSARRRTRATAGTLRALTWTNLCKIDHTQTEATAIRTTSLAQTKLVTWRRARSAW